jgi:hypothetical protein
VQSFFHNPGDDGQISESPDTKEQSLLRLVLFGDASFSLSTPSSSPPAAPGIFSGEALANLYLELAELSGLWADGEVL